MGTKSTKRAAKRRLPRPLRQGDLDGLCGVYSTVNAVRILCPELDKVDTGYIFSCLMHELPQIGLSAEEVVTGGLARSQVAKVIRRAATELATEYDIKLTVSRAPKELRQASDLDTLWGWLAGRITPSSVAVLGLAGRHSHWTVAIEVTAQQIRLFDSGDLGVLRRKSCTVGRAVNRFNIAPPQVFVIARKGDS